MANNLQRTKKFFNYIALSLFSGAAPTVAQSINMLGNDVQTGGTSFTYYNNDFPVFFDGPTT